MASARFCVNCGTILQHSNRACMRCETPLPMVAADHTPAIEGTLHSSCCLTPRDVRLLQEAASLHGGLLSPVGRAVAHKLNDAALRIQDEVPDGFVTLNSRVSFCLDDGEILSRVLVHWDRFSVPGLDLSVASAWGIALLGSRIGSEMIAYGESGPVRIRVKAIPHRPDAIAGAEPPLHKIATAPAQVIDFRSRAKQRVVAEYSEDDPGPSAA